MYDTEIDLLRNLVCSVEVSFHPILHCSKIHAIALKCRDAQHHKGQNALQSSLSLPSNASLCIF
ncbi:uncharacterized protein J3R85_021001 [Psidium guajava]|nr:uncharacterized protein J3R85_021001 [Psidium guajava]